MGQAANQIENHIENERQELGSNLRELEDKVKSVTDWHHQFKTSTSCIPGAGVWRRCGAGLHDRTTFRAQA